MKNMNNIILKNGFVSLIFEDEISFKKSLINSLSLKLNEAIKKTQNTININILSKNYGTIEFSDDLKYFVEFIQNYDPKIKNKFKFKNQSIINITESEVKALKNLFDALNNENRKILVEEILKSPASLKKQIEFYQKTKGLIS